MVILVILFLIADLFCVFPAAPNKQKQALELLTAGPCKTTVNCFKYIKLANSH